MGKIRLVIKIMKKGDFFLARIICKFEALLFNTFFLLWTIACKDGSIFPSLPVFTSFVT